MKLKQVISVLILSVILLFFITNCTDKTPVDDNRDMLALVDQSSCVNCHLNEDLLKQVADPLPDTGGEGSGEG